MNIVSYFVVLISIISFFPGNSYARFAGSAAYEYNNTPAVVVRKECDGYPDKSKYSCDELKEKYTKIISKKEKSDFLNERLRRSNYQMTIFDSNDLTEKCKMVATTKSIDYKSISKYFDKKTEIIQVNSTGPFNDWHERIYNRNMEDLSLAIEELTSSISLNNECMGVETILEYFGKLSYEDDGDLEKYKKNIKIHSCGRRPFSDYSCSDVEYVKLTIYSLLTRVTASYKNLYLYVNEIKGLQSNRKNKICRSYIQQAMKYRGKIGKELKGIENDVSGLVRGIPPGDSDHDNRYDLYVKKLASRLVDLNEKVSEKIENYRTNSTCS